MINKDNLYLLQLAGMSVDSGMLVVITIIAMYMTLVFGLLFYVKNEWCDILHHNLTVKN